MSEAGSPFELEGKGFPRTELGQEEPSRNVDRQHTKERTFTCLGRWKERFRQKGIRFGLVVSRFNDFISSKLVEGAVDALKRHGATEEQILLVKVPGAFEIPLAAKKLAESGQS